MRHIPTWDEYFLAIADTVRSKSRDPSSQIGCVIVDDDNQIVATGYNGLPRGAVYSKERLDKSVKLDYFEHAERNAIYAAGRRGVALKGCKLYLAGKHFSCLECARAIIQSGISEVFAPEPDLSNPHYKFQTALDLFEEGGVKIHFTTCRSNNGA